MFVTSHLGNWEWLLQSVTLELGYPVDAAYKPLHDPWAERLALEIRSRFGARLVPAKDLLIDHLRRHKIVRALAINADQAPMLTEKRHGSRFLGQDTAFYVGAEQIARAAGRKRGWNAFRFSPFACGKYRDPPRSAAC